jgi:hypothetical protein
MMDLPREAERIELFDAPTTEAPLRYEILVRGRTAVHDGDYIEALTVTEYGLYVLCYAVRYSDGGRAENLYCGRYLVEWMQTSDSKE